MEPVLAPLSKSNLIGATRQSPQKPGVVVISRNAGRVRKRNSKKEIEFLISNVRMANEYSKR
jgi:hypothetical protein